MSTQLRVGFKSVQGWRSYGAGSFLGIEPCTAGGTVGVGRLPTDSVGTATVAFVGVHADSEIRVYLPDGSEAAGIENCDADQVLSWPVYSVGSPNNTVRIVVMHLAYRLKEFSFTASKGAQSLPIQQERDPWYSNP